MPNMAIAEENQLSVYNWQYKTNNLIIETKRIVNEKKAKRRINWYRSPIAAADLARLNQRSDWRGMVQTLAFLAVLVCSGGLAWYAVGRAHWLVVIALIYLHGALHAFMVNGFHELCHKTVFKTGALNIFFRNVYSFLGWYSHVSFWASHQAHHRYTLHPPDDSEVLLPVDLTLKSYLRFAFVNPRGLVPAPEAGPAIVLRHYRKRLGAGALPARKTPTADACFSIGRASSSSAMD